MTKHRYQPRAQLRRMIDNKKVKRTPAAPSPANWDTMTEAERDEYRQEQQRIEDMELPDNLLFGG